MLELKEIQTNEIQNAMDTWIRKWESYKRLTEYI